MFGAPDAQWQRYPPGKKHGRYRQKQSISRANEQQRRHRAVIGKRKSHVAAEHRTGRTRVINPGALFRARPKSLVIVDLKSGDVEPVTVD